MSKARFFLFLGGLVLSVLTTACEGEDRVVEPTENGCRACHGNLKSAAPPRSLSGATDPSDPSVGAHETHLFGTRLGGPVACRQCHLEPKSVVAPGHIDSDLPAEVTWGPLAAKQDLAPVWDHETLTCQNTYCHGATLSGGTITTPIWNVVDGTQSDCGACHGMPPPAPHPANDVCEACHAPVAGLGNMLAIPTRHADGVLDVVDKSGCSACHGSMANEAPPRDLSDSSALTDLTVGAHQSHLAGGIFSRPVACVSCHQIPLSLEDPGHVDSGPPAELTFSGLALVDDAGPTWDRGAATCSNTYCHGATFADAALGNPKWNVVDGTQAACGSCHGLPPAAPHPADDRCEMCHLPTAGPNQSIANPKTHVDGTLQVALDNCTGCHGNAENLAPPVDAAGGADTSLLSVGAHQTHLSGGNNARPVACQTCHLVPNTVDEPSHIDGQPGAELTFSGLGAMPGSAPVFDASTAKCTNTYCHGVTLGGGTLKDPTWTEVGGEQAGCGSCHGLPPPAPHPASDQCMLCHAPTAGPNQQIANAATHIDGVLQATDGTCGDCHGTINNSAPPLDLAGQSDTRFETVGAHRSHVLGLSGISRPVACNECHLVPQNLEDPGHVDTPAPAELTFGALSAQGAARPRFDPVSLTCSNTYCHGATLGDGRLTSPRWTTVDGSQASCGSCHGLPPGGTHPRDDRCELCHLPTAGPGQTIADPSTHIDGRVQAVEGCDDCHGENGVSAPPLDLNGRTDPGELTVGAHRTHLSGGLLSKPLSCTECHVVPSQLDSPGHIDTALPAEITFGPIASMNAIPHWTSPTCTDTHCHAGPDAMNPSPTWNIADGTEAVCGSCHGTPPNSPVHQGGGDCANCHLPTAGPGMTIANRGTHVDGILQVAALDCSSCHGGPAGPAPPTDLDGDSDPSDPQVGAHQAHLTGGLVSSAVPCATCHLVPTVLDEPGHVDSDRPAEIAWSGLAAAELLSPVWDSTSQTCTNTYCHGGASSGGTNPAPVWNQPGASDCDSCHGLPPALPHPQRANCENCHGDVVGANLVIIDPTRHVDGIVDVDVSTCDACHGSPGEPAPPRDLDGMSDRLLITVGAHQTHLSGGVSSRPVECEQCHLVPQTLTDPGHIDSGAPAELTFGALATADGATPIWDRNQASCDNTYCHGSTYSLTFSPIWTVADGTQAECGSCHELPPPSPHPQNDQCELCHLPTAGPGMTIANRDTHVDGLVQVSVTGCTGCHGSGTNLAPPFDVGGQSSTSLPSVGAHQTHALGGFSSHPVACNDCHLVPLGLNDPGHVDTPLPAELTFSGVSVIGGASPSFNLTNNRCANTYCHGDSLTGGSNSSPQWTAVDGSEAACGSCHGLPPPAPHPASDQCMLCHGPTAGPNLQIADRSTHIDGILQATDGSCVDCHGSGANPAPPTNVSGESATTIRSVGAHRAHLEGTAGISRPVACGECHLVPQTLEDPGHVDTLAPAELTWGVLASADGANPSFTAQLTCSNTYCHGATLSGGALTAPSWVTADGSQSACGTCHGMPPPAPHPVDDRCELCHLPTGGPNQSIADPTTHIDGVLQVAAGCDACHGSSGVSAPPRDLQGLSATTRITVGAHRVHLAGGLMSKPVACTECHMVPATLQSPGHTDTAAPAEVTFGPIAGLGTNPSWTSPTCANTYCHAGVGATRPSPTWNIVNGTQATCGSCHGTPPNTPVHAGATECQNCHLPTAGPGLTIANPATHVDGIVQASDIGCDSCHGGSGVSSPPLDLDGDTAPTDPEVGAHQVHLQGGANSSPIACTTCHLVPSTLDAPGHVDTARPAELVWSGVAVAGLSTPAFTAGTRACSNTYCHGDPAVGGTNHAPVWNAPGTSDCGSCHALPPPLPHPAANNCDACHGPVAGPNQTIADTTRHVDGIVDVNISTCDTCHGSPASPAPPRDLAGVGTPTTVTVGAHQSHLQGGAFSKPVDCNQCHLVPQQLNDPGHIDTAAPAELSFGALARTDGASPAWNRNQATCGNTYCHGSTLPGPAAPTPVWTSVDGTQAACGSCHGLPPAAPHPQNDRCEMCHLPTAGAGMTIANRTSHIDGTVQVSVVGCTGCHGTAQNLAPPVDTLGQSSTSLPSVGAHQTHLAGGNSSHPVACDTCHLVPQNLNDPGHVDSALPAELTFSGVSRADGAAPAWNTSTDRCTNTYCHGGTLTGGSQVAPDWTVVDGSQAACGACHGLPPPAPHPDNSDCMLCHGPTAGPGLTIANLATHIDGVLQVSDGSCTSCHGTDPSPAPPINVAGQSNTTIRSVGAHASHLEAPSGISRPVTCTECHMVPQNLNDPGHVDSPAPAELIWGPLSSHGTTPSFDPTELTCNNNYCHGATLRDGTVSSPVWTIVDGSQSICGSCHGLPPSGTHPNDDRCELCHLPTAGPSFSIADPNTHIDGVLQVVTGCDTCHGSNGVSAPPNDLSGRTATTELTVGAHRSHLQGGLRSKPVACTECHVVPAELGSPGHTDTLAPAEITFGPLAGLNATPAWSTPRCNNTYCHAGPGASNPSPTWNVVNGTQAACGSCHGTPPNTPVHAGGGECQSCHLPTAGPGMTIANPDTHVDGIVQATAPGCDGCHGGGGNAPPVDLNGDTAPTDPQVGAHLVHMSGGAVSAPIACSTCHMVPTDLLDPGHVDSPPPAELTWSGLAVAQLSSPDWISGTRTCANTYCHGAASSGGSNPDPVWNAPGSAPCGSCHGLPPAGPHPQVDNCEACHAQVAGPNQTIIDTTRHVNGTVEYDDNLACQACHGTAQSPAPPADLAGSNNSPKVGAHQAHLQGTGRSSPVPCSECHITVNPSTLNQAGHYDTAQPAEVIFGVLSRTGGLNPSKSNLTCNNTYCHGVSLPGGTTPNPVWNGAALTCTGCHGNPPPDANHGNGTATQCQNCHPDTAGPGQTIVNPALHVNGLVDTSASCDACHGQNGDPAPPRDLAGLQSSPKVGAHQGHLNPTNAAPVECSTCHLVPNNYGDPGHADTAQPAEILWSGLALQDGTTPSYTAGQLRCNNTYCHGATLPGGATAVTWNDADGSERQCGACHGMPPPDTAHNGVGPNDCNTCHQDSAGANQTIIDPTLHIDGTVQVSGGSCDTCHASPPDPANESYPGSAGAHLAHAGMLGFECATCHGNNGSGPNHAQGGTTVLRANVDIIFNPAISYAGGTTMQNGVTPATYNSGNMTCRVGCHNPVVGNPPETPNLNNAPGWGQTTATCVSCHDTETNAPPRNHNIAALGDAGCLGCHSQTGHTGGTAQFLDPDPGDAFAYSATNFDGLCKTCHDGGGGTYFGNQTAQNVSPYWTVSSHGAEGYRCSECHSYHGSTNGPLLLDQSSTSCMASGCHNDLAATFNQVPGGPISHHRIEGGTGIQIACINCHNPHLAQASPLAAIDPDNKWTTYAMPATAVTQRKSNGDYTGFCLRCHDGTPPPGVQGALNIATALQGGSDPSQFRKGQTESLHRKEHNRYNCQNCHDWHGTPGTPGINRGRMLRNYMTINAFSASQHYPEKNNCTTRPGNFGMNFGCH